MKSLLNLLAVTLFTVSSVALSACCHPTNTVSNKSHQHPENSKARHEHSKMHHEHGDK